MWPRINFIYGGKDTKLQKLATVGLCANHARTMPSQY